MAPEYVKAAKILAEKDLFIAKIDTTEHVKTGKKFSITGFPTLKFFQNGVPTTYMGKPSAQSIAEYVIKKSQPPSSAISCDELSDIVSDKGSSQAINLIYFGASEGTSWDTFQKVGRQPDVDSFSFFHLNGDCPLPYETTPPKLAIIRTFDKPIIHYTGEMSVKSILSFMHLNQVPSVFEFAPEYINTVFKRGNPSAILFYEDGESELVGAFRSVAEEFAG